MEKDDLYKTLDRIISFINFCDTKAAVSLATIGVILTIFFSDSNMKEVKNIVNSALAMKCNGIITLYFISCILGLCIFLYGLVKLISVLIPRVNGEFLKNNDSNIFFEKIAKKSFDEFNDGITDSEESDLIYDLKVQIFNNSKICAKKYKLQRSGLINSLVGLGICSILYIVGIMSF